MASKRGGKRAGAGRPTGARNRATKDLKASLSEIARKHTPTAIAALVSVAKRSDSDSARVAAANALLDRAYGKPSQAHHHTGAVGSYDLTKVSDEDLDRLESILGPLTADAGADQGGEEAEAGGA
ncbi:MAG: hypothetical protein ACPHN2_08710 [Sinimarinibacterium flocculans]|uniref:hypothetical protein n=1 Tax=Sinimarinibacterium flocculans TaxID=985250 RepID=UPI003C670155